MSFDATRPAASSARGLRPAMPRAQAFDPQQGRMVLIASESEARFHLAKTSLSLSIIKCSFRRLRIQTVQNLDNQIARNFRPIPGGRSNIVYRTDLSHRRL